MESGVAGARPSDVAVAGVQARVLLALAAIALAGCAWASILRSYFASDDFLHLYHLANLGPRDVVLTPFGGHMLVVRNLSHGERLVLTHGLAADSEHESADAITALVSIARRLWATSDAQATSEDAIAASETYRARGGQPYEHQTRDDNREQRASGRHWAPPAGR